MSQTVDLLLRGARLPDRDAPVDIAIVGPHIVGVDTAPRTAHRTIDIGGRLVTPGLVESHIHLDKALLADRVTASTGTLEEAIRLTGEVKRAFTVDDIRERARRVLDVAVRAGTTAMRSHVEVDPIVGLTGIEAMLPLREEYAPALDLQLCAFAQEGIVKVPGTEALLRRALMMGADLVGGCPYNDTDGPEHIRIVFALATAFGVDADFHADFADEPEHLHVREIAALTEQLGWQGRVAVGHLSELAAVPVYRQDELIAEILGAGLGVIALPATDLYLMGRHDEANVRRGLTPIRRLLQAGVRVALSSNNIRNLFTPVGTADLTHMAFVAAVAAHMGTPADLRALLAAVTVHPAHILRLPGYGLAVGAYADLVVWDCARPEDTVTTLPVRPLVLKRGRITVETDHRVIDHWRARP
ncbi:MAG TPA: amidohydrolase family protein [Methylomirabilota bacterium]|nr:amidohydrolase family protein [Methylomirabilota bacterium]